MGPDDAASSSNPSDSPNSSTSSTDGPKSAPTPTGNRLVLPGEQKKTWKPKKPRPCPHCNKIVRSQFARHLRTHSPEQVFKCPEEGCPRAYGRRSDLADHLKDHTKPNRPAPAPAQQPLPTA